jgi:8-oxo-dGTP pyrophosphatase MutT (NUDIX family)
MNNKPETWKRSKSETIADCRVFNVRKDFCQRDSDGAESTFFVVENPDWVNVIALTETGQIILIEQYRHGSEEIILEIPGGMVDEGESHSITAARELLEETGFAPAEMIPLGKSRPNPAIQNNWIYHYLALDCEIKSDTKFDEHESISVKLVPLSEIPQLISEGAITHSLVIAAFSFFYSKELTAHKQNKY